MGESGGGSLTGPRLHRFQVLRSQDDRRRCVEVTSRRQPHTPLVNVNTPYNPIRLLKGAPPGQEAVNHYISELSIVKTGNHKLDTKYRKHLAMVEACEDEYDYHHKLFGQG